MKASELKNKGIKITLGNEVYELKFNMNTFCELEEVYGDLNKAFDDLQAMKIKAIRALIYAAVKVEKEEVTLKEIGEMLGINDLERLGKAINEALSTSMPEAEENLGE
ncbi:tail assembly chaperone [Natranaerovirga pectinivora]|uniref:Tail assembly chaperone n=1 Tax=Natranaerovirga pectinivora TaxID=682400 RepID=A0A4V2V083_9FIRM|nr:tail assembly chaperone [Natranaerovirga pectinivora]TCT14573.1 tail assembly chaperone [Natranaerovirga pectinivora]